MPKKYHNSDKSDNPSPKHSCELGEALVKEYRALKAKRDTLQQQFRDLAWNFMPAMYEQIVHNDRQADSGRYNTPADTIGLDMINTLASALYSNTVSTNDRWFVLRSAAEELNEYEDVADFYTKLTDITIKAIQNSNFSLMIHETLRMATCFGTGVIGSDYDVKNEQLNFNVMRITDCAISENSKGVVETLFYEFRLTAVQAAEAFGVENLPKKIQDVLNVPNKQHEQNTYIRCVKPRTSYDKKSELNKDMPFMDTVVHQDTKMIVSEGGHIEFPYSVHRFDRIEGTPYGRCPAMNGLGTITMLNRMLADYIDGVELTLQPPIFLPHGAEDVSLSPGAVNQFDATAGGRPHWMNLGIDLNGTLELIHRYQDQLRDIFFVDKFVALENQKNMTATEVIERVNEKIQAISPVVARLQSELLEPLIERVVRLLVTNGRAPDIPEVLLEYNQKHGVAGNEFKVEYTTRLNAKLAEIDTNNLMMALQEVSMVLQQTSEIPEMDIILNKDEVVKMIFRNHRVDPDLTKSKREIDELRTQQATQQAAMTSAEMVKGLIQPIDTQQPAEEGSAAEQINELF